MKVHHDTKHKITKMICVFIVSLSIIITALVIYNQNLDKNMYHFTENSHHELTLLQKYNFDREIDSELQLLKNVAATFSYMPDNEKLILKILNHTFKQSNFEYIGIVNNNGVGISNDGSVMRVSNKVYFKQALSGKSYISDPIESSIKPGFMVIPIATPIFKDHVVVGVFIGVYSAEKLDSFLFSTFDQRSDTMILNSKDGNIIASTRKDHHLPEKSNVFSIIETAKFKDGYSLDNIKQNMSVGTVGCSQYELDGAYRYIHYVPLQRDGWYMLSVITDDIMYETSGIISRNALILTIVVMTVFAAFIMYVLFIQKSHLKTVEKVAYFDDLTELPNLNMFKIRAQKILDEHPKKSFVVIKFDIINFKVINERFNSETGNNLIRGIGELIKKVSADANSKAVCARIYADEFIIFDDSENLKISASIRETFEELCKETLSPLLDGQQVNFRYGRYIVEPGGEEIDSVVEKVNIAHRLAKVTPGSNVCDYDDAYKKKLLQEAEIEHRMLNALLNDEFMVYMQPKYSLEDDSIVGAEALVRWTTSEGILMFPNDFIPLFEKNGFIVQLDMYMLEKVAMFIRDRLDKGLPVVTISVNFSRIHLNNEHFVEQLNQIVEKYNIPRKYIELELTESTIFENEELLVNIFHELHDLGYILSMDDFGRGYSSLGLLKNLPVDVIKMDRDFFTSSISDPKARLIIESTIQMATQLSIHTVAEGVENKEHVSLLKEIGCDVVQGYYYSKPVPSGEFSKMLLTKSLKE